MQTSQTKKGNPTRNSRAVLMKKREGAALSRARDLGIPWGPPHIHECPYCAAREVPLESGVTRIGKSVLVCSSCHAAIPVGTATYHQPPPKRKQKRERDSTQ